MILSYNESKYWFRRLSQDTVKTNIRELSKLASGNALVIFDTIVTSAKSYNNSIEAAI